MLKLFALLAGLLPFLAAAQALPPSSPAPPPAAVAAPDSSAGWQVQLEAYTRTSYLGREYGQRDYSLCPQLSYEAASGFYGKLEGLYFSPVRPAYVYTDLELGYADQPTDHWTYSLSASRTFYTGHTAHPDSVLRNGLEAYTSYTLGPVATSLDYNLLLDHFQAHTLSLEASWPLTSKRVPGLDQVSLTPAAAITWGSALALLRFGTLAAPLEPRFANLHRSSLRLLPLTYEFTLPLEVQRGLLTLSLTGHLLVPLRVRGESEEPPTFGYLSAALGVRLPRRHPQP